MKQNCDISLFILFLIVFLPGISISQRSTTFYEENCSVDSLKGLLEDAGDEYRVQLLVKISHQFYLKEEYEKALNWIEQAEDLGIRIGYETGLHYVYDLKGYILLHMQEPDSVLATWERAVNSIREADNDILKERLFYQQAIYEWKLKQDVSYAQEHLKHLSTIYDTVLDPYLLSTKYYNLASIFNQAKRYSEEWTAVEKMNELIVSCGISPDVYNGSFINMYGYRGRFCKDHSDYSGAIRYYQQGLEDMNLLNLIPSQIKDLEARLYNSISRTYLDWGKYEEALRFQKRAISTYHQIGKATGKHGGIIDLSNYLEGTGYAFLRLEYYDSAQYYFNRSKEIRLKTDDKLGIAMSDDGLGETYLELGNYFLALEHLDSSLARKNSYLDFWMEYISDKTNPGILRVYVIKKSMATTRLLMGMLYRDWDRNELALTYFKESLYDASQGHGQLGQTLALKELGMTYQKMNDHEMARKYFEDALKRTDTLDIHIERARILYALSNLELSEGNDNYFLYYSNQADSLFRESGVNRDHSKVMKDLGLYWLRKGDLEKSVQLLTGAYDISEKNGLKRISMECCEGLADIYAKKDVLNLAWFYIKRFHQLKSEVYDLDALKKINQVDAVYQLTKKVAELDRLSLEKELQDLRMKQNRYLMISLGAILIVLLLFFILLMRNNRMKALQNTLLLERRLLRSQMNPHFIFNALTNIQESIFKQDADKASKYLVHFSRMIRNILESTREEYVMLQTEIELIHDYLELQKLRHDNKFDFLIEVDDAIDPEVIQVPPMLTQPFIENAVEHGIRQKKGQGRIEIRFFMTGSTLHFMVQDDGIGREAAGRTGSNKGKLHRAMSSQITLERLQILNRKQRPEVLIHITDLFDDEGNPAGTRVEFEMPITG